MLTEDGRIDGEIHPEEDSPIGGQVCSFAFYCTMNVLTK